MSGTEPAAARLPLLFLVADTGGGHRNAARAVGQALDRLYPGRFAPVLCDPLGGPGSARLLRLVTGLYGSSRVPTMLLAGAREGLAEVAGAREGPAEVAGVREGPAEVAGERQRRGGAC